MEETGMADDQFNQALQMIIHLIEGSETKEEAVAKIKDLLK